MRNTRKVFGGQEAIEPLKVVVIGFAYDSYKKPMLPDLWKEAYNKIRMQMPLLDPEKEFFWSETKPFNASGLILFETRYFTPADNLREIKN